MLLFRSSWHRTELNCKRERCGFDSYFYVFVTRNVTGQSAALISVMAKIDGK